MNKIVKINCIDLYDLAEFEPVRAVEGDYYEFSWKEFDMYLTSQYGMKISDDVDCSYKIVDDSKFALFMLKYPEYIEEITYE
jgi:hypothetical protein